MQISRTLARAAVALTVALAACTPAGTPAPTGPATNTGAPSPAGTGASTASPAASPAATTAATIAASPAAATPAGASPGTSPASSPAGSPGTAQIAYAMFAPQTGSSTSVSGAATLVDSGGSTVVVIGVVQTGTGGIAAAIQEGTCASPNPLIKFQLTPLVAGASVTTVDVSLAEVLAADHVVNLFVAGSETESSISCGDIQVLPASTP